MRGEENSSVTIKDINGINMLIEKNVQDALHINTSAWPIGIYFITTQSRSGTMTVSKAIKI